MNFRLKLARGNSLKMKVATRIPAQLFGGDGISVSRTNQVYAVALDLDGLQEMAAISAPLEATTFLPTWEAVGDDFSRISITNLKADLEGTFDGIYQPLDAALTALAALDSTAGLLTQTGADTFARRTLTGTANEVTVTNGDGDADNPTISLPATLTLTGKTVTVDTQLQSDDSTKAASTSYVRAAISGVLDGVASAFDTLSEIAAELALKTHSATTITAGAGLTGGGDLSANRTLAVGAGTGITVNGDDVALSDMAQSTVKGRAAGAGSGAPTDLSATQATAILNAFVGDSGSGGTKGLVPAPTTGDATKFLRGDGTFVAVGGGGDMLVANNLSDVADIATSRSNLQAMRAVVTRTIYASGSGTYNVPAGAIYLRVRVVGGGGGASGSGTSPGAGGAGGNSTFGSLTANGGVQGTGGGSAGTGGAASGGDLNYAGQGGSPATSQSQWPGGIGGNSIYAAGAGTLTFGQGRDGTANTGGGGSGAGSGASTLTGAGGGGGGFVDKLIDSPSSTYSYAVGAGGTGGTAGSGGSAGGAGGSGVIIIEEFYQ